MREFDNIYISKCSGNGILVLVFICSKLKHRLDYKHLHTQYVFYHVLQIELNTKQLEAKLLF